MFLKPYKETCLLFNKEYSLILGFLEFNPLSSSRQLAAAEESEHDPVPKVFSDPRKKTYILSWATYL